MIRYFLSALALLGAAPAFGQTRPAVPVDPSAREAERCQALEGGAFQGLPGAPTWIMKASYQAATTERQAACVIEGYVNPTINFAMYLPVTKWNGRYLVRGCGGSCGKVMIEPACGLHLRDGYACLFSDMGHSSTMVDNNWVANNLQGLVDFGYRATHVTTVAGKALIKAFYSTDPRKSYFFACSTGGRQGLIEAQRFPEDFDGIVAIAPASLAPFGLKKPATISDIDRFNLDPSGRPILPNRKALLIHAAVVRACDRDDGLSDGIIGDPVRCRWKPEDIQCKGSEARNCLTAAQVAVVNKLYSWRGAQKGSEFNWIGSYLRNAALPGEPSKPLFDLGLGRGDPATIETMVNPNNPDLRPFRDNGGKLILVHGWSDHSVLPLPTIDYYETMTKTMDGPAATRTFARLFMIPGMDHCAGGEGAYAIDYLAAITAWVERGEAPDKLRGVHPVAGAPLDYFGIDLPNLDRQYYAFERDHHAYPKGSVAVGKPARVGADNRRLAERLAETLTRAEANARAANFPRQNILNAMAKSVWELFYASGSNIDQQTAAVAQLDQASLSPLARETMSRMQAELALD
jgi:feruloyl esterase